MANNDKSRVRIQLLRDSLENWQKNSSFIPKLAEPFLVTDKHWLFLGDGFSLAAELVCSPELAYQVGSSGGDISGLEEAIIELQKQVAYLETQHPIKVVSFKYQGNNVYEIGTHLNEVTFTCSFNKTPVIIYLNGKDITTLENITITTDATKLNYTITLSNLDISTTTIWRLKAKDEQNSTSEETSQTISFYSGLYYGIYEQGTNLDAEFIRNLTKRLKPDCELEFSVNAGPIDQIAYALPVRYGTPNFKDKATTLGAAFYQAVDSIMFKNASDHEEAYSIWLSTNTGLGQTTIIVSKK